MTSNSSGRKTAGVTRRAMLQTTTAAATAVAFTLKPTTADAACNLPAHPVEYNAANPLTDQNIAPLFAAWLILTTNAPDPPSSLLIQEVANLGPVTADFIFGIYNNQDCKQAFLTVRNYFGCLAHHFAPTHTGSTPPPYSGGQCPEIIDTISPVSTVNTSHPATTCAVNNPSSTGLICPDCFPQELKLKPQKK
ncbi:MAG: hypothetical protein WAL56_04195 [Candidatus Sulfotelmatobacter sp.]